MNVTLPSVTFPYLQPCHRWAPLCVSLPLSLRKTSAYGLCTWQPQNSWTSYMVAEGSQSKCLREARRLAASPIWFSLESHLVQLLPYFTYYGSHKWSGIRTADIHSISWLKECQRNCRHILKPPWPPLLLQPIWNTNSPYFLVWKIPIQTQFWKFNFTFNLNYLLFAPRFNWIVLVLFTTFCPFTHCCFWLLQIKGKKLGMRWKGTKLSFYLAQCWKLSFMADSQRLTPSLMG